MRILNVHNHQRMVGGAERASLELQKILRAAGHEVIPFALAHPDNEPSPYSKFFVTDPREGEEDFSPFEKLRASARIVYNREAR
ncbi:MAG: glycosyltransferase family 1 protein, partial [Deltaproteobacteria bacterium]